MKSCLLCIIMLFFSCSSQKKNVNTTDSSLITDQEKIIAKNLIQGAFDDLWAGLDSTKILDYHTEDFIILENGAIWDNIRIKKYMRDKLAKEDRPRRVNMMEYISIDKYGPSMQIAYQNNAEFHNQDSLLYTGAWLESALAVKTDHGWRLKMMHSTWNRR